MVLRSHGKTRSSIWVATAALVFGFGLLTSPLRPCPHHQPPTAAAGAPWHDADHGSDGDSHGPCMCLSECDAHSVYLATVAAPPALGWLPAPSADLFAPSHEVLPTGPAHRAFPFPNPPPLAA